MKTSTAHLVVIGTQPKFTKAVCDEIHDAIERFSASQRPVILTVCPGITTAQLESWLPAETPIMRSMPNTPVAVRQGATAVFMNDFVNPESMEEIKLVLSSVSPCIENLSREDLLDVAASVSG
jgi:pyrroline-5-carboxylate reductase